MTYNILSPDGIEIRHEDFKTKDEAIKFFFEWQKRFAHQGYYSSVNGKIPLEDLELECEIVKR